MSDHDRERRELADLVAGWRQVDEDDARATTLSGAGESELADSYRILAGVAAFGAPDPHPDLGPFEPLELIGEGGMGEVWLARQSEPLDRLVAVKVIRLGMDSRRVLQRFDGERAALARMEHPNIATVLDAGLIGDGRPYFAMPFVRGAPITTYCDEHRLGIRERLELFLPVCDAVQHAHHRGIIHRDGKPSNVLVEEIDGRAVPKVIDFGIAKSTTVDLDEDSDAGVTEIGQLVGTPEYMAPEQADFTGRNVDARADIYALGVLLYELLGGALPFDPDELRADGISGIHRTLTTVDPPRLSVRATRNADAASLRGLTPAALSRALRSDLEWICLRAMERDRDRRYSASADLAGDIRRHLRNEPVQAGPPGLAYRFRKLVRRRRGLMAGVGAAIVLVVAGTGATAWQAIRATRAEAEARRQAEVATTVNDFLAGVLTKADTEVNPEARRVTLIEVIDEIAAEMGASFVGQPDEEAQVRVVVADVYSSLGRYDEAEQHFARALELVRSDRRIRVLDRAVMNDIRRSQLVSAEARAREALKLEVARGGDPVAMSERFFSLGRVQKHRDRIAEADSLVRLSFESLEAAPPEFREPGEPLIQLSAMIMNSMGRFAEAESLLTEAVVRYRERRGADDPNLGRMLSSLGENRLDAGQPEDAEPHFREAAELLLRIEGESPSYASAVGGLGRVRFVVGDYTAADSLLTLSLTLRRAAHHGEDDAGTSAILSHLGRLYHATDRLQEAEPVMREALAMNRRLTGDGPHLWDSVNNLAAVNRKLENYDEAERLFRKALGWGAEMFGDEHFQMAIVRQNLAGTLTDAGRPADGEALYDEAMRVAAKVFPDGHATPVLIQANYGDCLRQQGRWSDAIAVLEDAHAAGQSALGDEHPRVLRIERWLEAARAGRDERMP